MDADQLRSLAEECARLAALKEKKKEINSHYGRKIKDAERKINALMSEFKGAPLEEDDDFDLDGDD